MEKSHVKSVLLIFKRNQNKITFFFFCLKNCFNFSRSSKANPELGSCFFLLLVDNFSLELKPPNERELFVNDKVVLQVVVSGDKCQSAEKASVACKVKNESGNIYFSEDTSPFIRVKNVTVDANKWFDGEPVTCTIHDPNNNRDFQWEIRFDKGGK